VRLIFLVGGHVWQGDETLANAGFLPITANNPNSLATGTGGLALLLGFARTRSTSSFTEVAVVVVRLVRLLHATTHTGLRLGRVSLRPNKLLIGGENVIKLAFNRSSGRVVTAVG
jgi:hypothetical protein